MDKKKQMRRITKEYNVFTCTLDNQAYIETCEVISLYNQYKPLEWNGITKNQLLFTVL